MEYLSDDHLDRYREILERTDSKFQEFASLEKTHGRLLGDLTLCDLLGTDHFRRLSRLSARLFQNPLDVFSLYGDEVPNGARGLLGRPQQCCCLFEIDLSGTIRKLLKDREWYLSVSVLTRDGTVTLANRTGRFVDVVPIESGGSEVNVSSTLYVSIQGDWVGFESEDVNIDVSYKISSVSIDATTSLLCSYPLCDDFIPIFFENCYHNVDPGVFVQLENGSKDLFEFSLLNFPKDKSALQPLHKNRSICIRSSSADCLYLLKRYLNEALAERFVVSQDRRVFKEIARMRSLRVDNVQDAEVLYKAARDLWYGMIRAK